MSSAKWQISVDTGGTFTDCVAKSPDGREQYLKVLSSGRLRVAVEQAAATEITLKRPLPEHWDLRGFKLLTAPGSAPHLIRNRSGSRISVDTPFSSVPATVDILTGEDAPRLACRLATGCAGDSQLPAMELRVATTRGTNALLERNGAAVALFVTEGFADAHLIGTQQRPDLFALQITKPAPLYQQVFEVRERLDNDGNVITAIDLEHLTARAKRARDQGMHVASIALVNSYRNPQHEQAAKTVLAQLGFTTICLSSDLGDRIGYLERSVAATVDAYLTPIIGDFVADLVGAEGDPPQLMTSAGGLTRSDQFRPKDSLLSGPAAGVVGAAASANQHATAKHGQSAISFDMGGTSTDVARFDDGFDYVSELTVGPATLTTAAVAIETVAAGGGSICTIRDGRIAVGPQSAGASPGPACYGASGPLTVTDVNLLLGRLPEQRISIPIDHAAAEQAAEQLLAQLRQADREIEREQMLSGLLDIANEKMADAIRQISIRRGYQPADHTLVAFGGAGPMHACGVADRLGMSRVLVPGRAGVLSAQGLGQARLERLSERTVLAPLAATLPDLPQAVAQLADQAAVQIVRSGGDPDRVITVRRTAHLRLLGQDTSLPIDFSLGDDLAAAFTKRYRHVYGHRPPERTIEIERLVVLCAEQGSADMEDPQPSPTNGRGQPAQTRLFDGASWIAAPVYHRDALPADWQADGPLMVVDDLATTYVDRGWNVCRLGDGSLELRQVESHKAAEQSKPIALELFASQLTTAAEEMGELLKRCALSTNIKERQDYSCAVLDRDGQLLVNAPHIPVHLGALGACVRAVAKQLTLNPGDVVITNHPGFGGSHLPDVTLISPVFAEGTLVGYVANRAHHAEIGGARPGSMPPSATRLEDEGVIIPPTKLLEGGVADWDRIRRLLSEAPYPSRNADENVADLQAQVAAAVHGEKAVQALAQKYGIQRLTHLMSQIYRLSAAAARRAISRKQDDTYQARASLDDGTPLAVTISIEQDAAVFDFEGCGDVHPGNLNATPAIVRSAVLYVLRLMIDKPLPLNEGLLDSVTIRLPYSVLNPDFERRPAPAVVGGNVETSQQIVDLMLEALGLMANSQGTMNNVLFGNERFGYYETLCGGTGAGPGFAGADAVHSHMTNTRITDPEVLEHRFPVRVQRFARRANSGGPGRHRGGNGAIRELLFTEALELSLVTQRRVTGARGIAGGQPGARGRQVLIRGNETISLAGISAHEIQPGDRLLIETPGGGGYGTT